MIEALVAITVLTIGVVQTLSILSSSLVNADYAKNQITAFFLAQEGQELVIGKRNVNRLNGKTNPVNTLGDQDSDNDADADDYWLKGMRRCFDACYIGTADIVNQPKRFQNCDGACPKLKLNPNGFYGYLEDGEDTIFTREITVTPFSVLGETPDNSERGAAVQVTVRWHDRPSAPERSFTINSFIYR